jgi:hypothetical protein
MAAILRERRVLFVIDDVWSARHAGALFVGGPRSAILVTTRDRAVAEAIAPRERELYVLNVLSDEDGLALLRELAASVVDDYPIESVELVRELEGLPLAIQVAGRLLRREEYRGKGVDNLLREIRSVAALLKEHAPPDMIELTKDTTPTVISLLKKSTDVLDELTRIRFALLGVVKEKPATFSADFLAYQWETPDPNPTADILIDRGLIETVGDGENRRFKMHSLLVAFANSMLAK